jgi:hypothetical protein
MAHQKTLIHETPTIDHHAGKQCPPPPAPLRSAHLRVSRVLPRASGIGAWLFTLMMDSSACRTPIRGHVAANGLRATMLVRARTLSQYETGHGGMQAVKITSRRQLGRDACSTQGDLSVS